MIRALIQGLRDGWDKPYGRPVARTHPTRAQERAHTLGQNIGRWAHRLDHV